MFLAGFRVGDDRKHAALRKRGHNVAEPHKDMTFTPPPRHWVQAEKSKSGFDRHPGGCSFLLPPL